MLEQVAAGGVLKQTRSVLQKLHLRILHLLANTEREAGGSENWALRLMIFKLDVGNDGAKDIEESDSPWAVNQQPACVGCEENSRPVDLFVSSGSSETY
jgi:ophiobolin F synthase